MRGFRGLARAVAGAGFMLTAVLWGQAARAEPIDYFKLDGVTYNEAIETPDAFFGYGLGDRPIRHDKMVAYLRKLAAESDRMTVETIGYSFEGRPILFFVVSKPENLARIDAIRAAHLAHLTGERDAPRAGPGEPVVVWLNYGVHGAESSGMDAAVPVLYHLAAAEGAGIEKILNESVLVITAIFNPDGHTRRVDHLERFGADIPVTDPFNVQHQLWITARTNHYWFDLNRQWLLQTQPESRAWLAKWHHWKPNVTADFHEMGSGSTYYFHPGVPARTNPLIPKRSEELMAAIATHHSDWMDSEAKLYFSQEGYDNFYIGKGSTYPHVNGSIGFLFEAGSARGGRIETPNGMKTYADNIRTHFHTSLTTIEGALANRDELLAYQRQFYQDNLAEADRGQTKAWVFAAPGDAVRAYHFIDLLKRHDIHVYRLARDVRADGREYKAGEAYVVPMEQPQYRMIRGLFDRVTEFEEAVFYDVSGWTMPLIYGLDYDALRSTPDMGTEAEPVFPRFEAPGPAPYGYVFEWSNYYAPRALYRVLSAGLIARGAFEPVDIVTTKGRRSFGRGSIFVPFDRQTVPRERIAEIMATIADQDGFEVFGVVSGHTPTPGRDLGANNSVQPLQKPSVLLLFDEGLSYYDTGEVWHLLDHRMKMPVTMAAQSSLTQADWSRYTHIIMAGGRVTLSDPLTDRLKQWVREEGGTLIAAGGASVWAEEKILGRKAEEDASSGTEDAAPPERYDYLELSVKSAEHIIGGALFASDLDITHPLGFGYRERFIATQRNSTRVLRRPENPVATVAQYAKKPLLSGYASQRRLDEIGGTPMTVAERLGNGAVVLFADDLNFRATYFGTTKLFMNAIFYAPNIDTPTFGAAN